MTAIIGILTAAVVGIILLGYDISANMASWGSLQDAHIARWSGVLLILLALGGGVYKALNR